MALFFAACAVVCGRGTAPRGVVLIVVDTLRADHLGAYGYARPTSPHIDSLAADGTLFRTALSPSPWTLPALATLMTSLYPSVHGARLGSDVWALGWLLDPEGFEPATRLDPSRTALAEILRERGFATAAFVQGAYPSAVFGFDQGFDYFSDNAGPGMRFDIEDALRWLDQERPERFFLYLHTVEVHAPYARVEFNPLFARRWPEERREYFAEALREEQARFASFAIEDGYRGKIDGSLGGIRALKRRAPHVPARDRDHLVALYDQGIGYTDYWIGRFIDALAERGLLDESIVVLTSDHGEEFLDHGSFEHSRTFYEELLRVPLILRVPGEGRGRVIEKQVGLVDVLPTLLDLLEIEIPRHAQGRSLRPFLRGEALPDRLQFGEASTEPGQRSVRTNEWKYVRRGAGSEELYDLLRDPEEQINRCAENRKECLRLRWELQKFVRRTREEAATLPAPKRAEVDDETRARLRALGYAEE